MANLFKVHNIDARELDTVINKAVVDVTVTSPPYFNLKDYGCKDQIGFGQNYEEYLNDLRTVFEKVFKVTKETGSLWVIIDTFREDRKVVPLPFDFSNKIREVGWCLQDIIVWHKDKTLPWSGKGQTRSIFEYVLLFAKSTKYKYYADKEREYNPVNLKKWWIKYPERYNPKGKALDEIWKYPIPTQGSWGKGYIRHFCPLPSELISRIIRLATNEGDIVLDPFAGSGSVLVEASCMNRKYVGFELNKSYIRMFEKYLKNTFASKQREYEQSKNKMVLQKEFEKTIVNLRILKYARSIYKLLSKILQKNVSGILIKKGKGNINGAVTIANAEITYFLNNNSLQNSKLREAILSLSSKPPLSKYGLVVKHSIREGNSFQRVLKRGKYHYYSRSVTHRPLSEARVAKEFCIISPIKVNIDEKIYSS